MSMFSDLVEEVMEIFMDDFTVYGSSFDHCLNNLETVLQRCNDKQLALNWEKCHFMVTEGIVLGHKISATGLEVDQSKVSIIKTLAPPTTVKGIRSFLGHAGFYRRFIKDFSKIARPLCRLLEKETKFNFDDFCKAAFEEIKLKLVQAPIRLHHNGIRGLKQCVMPVISQWELYWGKEKRRYSEPYTMLAEPSMKPKKTIQLLKRRC